jgi:hypothetical protein
LHSNKKLTETSETLDLPGLSEVSFLYFWEINRGGDSSNDFSTSIYQPKYALSK